MQINLLFLVLPALIATQDVWSGLGSKAVVEKFVESRTPTALDVIRISEGVVVVGKETYTLEDCLADVGENSKKQIILQVPNFKTLQKLNETVVQTKPSFAVFLMRIFSGPNGSLPPLTPQAFYNLKMMNWPTDTKICVGFTSSVVGKHKGYSKTDKHWVEMVLGLSYYVSMVELDATLLSNSGNDFYGREAGLLKRIPFILLRNVAMDSIENIEHLKNIIYNWVGREKFILEEEKPTTGTATRAASIKFLWFVLLLHGCS